MRRSGLLSIGAAWIVSLGVQGIAFGWMAPPDSVCAPRSDGRKCSDTRCPANNEKCQPSLLVCDAKGRCKVADCDCGRPNACHVELTGPRDGLRPVCEGECPPGAECEMKREAHDDGTTSVWCECVQQACEPTSNGLSCQDHSCPNANDRCIPQAVHCDAAGRCRVVKCDCQPRDECRLSIPRDGRLEKNDFRFCRGDCPDGTRCEETRTALADGGFEVVCNCVQEECEPTRDGRRCREFDCPGHGERCTPQAVECDATGHCEVILCDCDRPNHCHPEITNGHQDPPVICTGACPDGTRCSREVSPTPTGGWIVRCDCEPIPTVCEPNSTGTGCTQVNCPNRDEKCVPQEVVCIPGAPCRVTKCDCERSDRCHVQLTNATGPTCVGNCPDGFDCERVQTPIAGGGFSVRCDCIPEPPECEPVETGFGCKPALCPASNEKCIPIAVAVSANGVVRVLACDCRPADECHIVPSPLDIFPPQFDCDGSCPPGRECHERTVTTDNGTVITRCDCNPVDPQCGPNSTGTGCRPITCPDPTQKCKPNKVFCDLNNVCRVVDCDCMGNDRCHVEMTAAAGPFCVGGCPDGQTCEREVTTTPAGTFIECRCEPEVEPCHAEVNPATNTVICKGVCPPGSECRQIVIGGTVTCECVPVQPDCHRELDAAGNIVCKGVCPPGEICRPINITSPDGTTFIDCRCEPVQPPCHREVDASGEIVCKGVCPPGEVCTRVVITVPGAIPFVDCRCEPVVEPCHAEVDPASNTVICKGVCPQGTECRRFELNGAVTCDCVPVQQPCHRELDGNGNIVCVGVCPPGEKCTLVVVVDPDGTTFADCRCEPVVEPCHAEVDPATGVVVCKGVCPVGSECRQTIVGGTVTCNCEPIQQICHRELDAAGNVVCVGGCPAPNNCIRVSITNPDGTTFIDCRCQPLQQPCHREIGADGDFFCVGTCPPGQTCHLTTIVNDDGTVTTDCFCEDIPQPCHAEVDPATNVVVCKGVCPPGSECRRFEANGAVTCDCVPVQTFCHLDIDADGNNVCVGVCPQGETCMLIVLTAPDGTTITDCRCRPIVEPCHAEVDPVTNTVICKGVCPPGQECRRFENNGGVTCTCVPVQQPCHREIDANGNVICTGVCPPGEVCRLGVITNPDGTVFTDCRCEPIVEPCHAVVVPATGAIDCVGTCPPGFTCHRFEVNGAVTCDCAPIVVPCQPDSTTDTGCSNSVCPTGEKCIPIAVSVTASGAVTVIACDCRGADECHIVPTGPAGVIPPQFDCAGTCPTGFVCQEVNLSTSAGDTVTRCDCLPQPACDPDMTSPTGCHLTVCPDANTRCLPVRVNCFEGACRVVECECQPFDRCHVTVTTAGQATCIGGCPIDAVCMQFDTTTDKGEVIVECACVVP